MVTAQNWIDDTRNLLLSGIQQERNSLSVNYTAGSGALNFTGPLGGIAPGKRLSAGMTNFYVQSVTAVDNEAQVLGGQDGTTDANLTAGTTVWVSPRFTDSEIFNALNAELSALASPGNGLFQIKTVDLTWTAGTTGYDMTGVTGVLEIYEVRAQSGSDANDWPRVHQNQWRLNRNSDTTLFPSGLSLEVFSGAVTGGTVRVLYKAGFTFLTDATTDVSTTGLPLSAYDVPKWGAALQVMAGREVKRNQIEAQGDTRRAAEVPAGAVAGSWRGIAAVRDQRIQDEAQRLSARYPDRRW